MVYLQKNKKMNIENCTEGKYNPLLGDFTTVDMDIDEYSEKYGFDNYDIVKLISERYGVSIAEVDKWLNISKGNLSVATKILSNLTQYKRSENNEKCETETKTEPCRNIQKLYFSEEKMEKKEESIDFSTVEKYLTGEPISVDGLFNKTGISRKSLIALLANEFKAPHYIVMALIKNYGDNLNKICEMLSTINENYNDVKYKSTYDFFGSKEDTLQQVKNKDYTYVQKDENSPIYCKLKNGELLGPFYKDEEHRKNAALHLKETRFETEISVLIEKLPNIQVLIEYIKRKYPQEYKNAEEGVVYYPKNENNTPSEQPKVCEWIGSDRSNRIIEKMELSKKADDTNPYLSEKLKFLENKLDNFQRIMENKNKYFDNKLSLLEEIMENRNDIIKDVLKQLIEKL